MNKYGGINDMPNKESPMLIWKILSCFANDIKKLEGYNDWMNKTGYCLDSENIRDVSKRHPNITKKANEANQTKYVLEANGVTLLFDSEKSACEFLGVKKCSVSSCYHKGYKCKGYRIAKMDGGVDR